jgi:glycosyltransferase involved in cell wall biosynthesis
VKVLVVDEEWPHPPDSGKRIRTWALLARLARSHEIALVHPRRGEGTVDEAVARGAGIRSVPVDLPPIRKRGLRFAWDLARNVFRRVPYMAMAHRSRAVERAVASEASTWKPDLVHVEWTPLVANVPPDVGVPVCVAAHNVEADLWERTVAAQPTFARRAYARLQWKKVARFERAALAAADSVIAVSDGDAARIRTWTGQPRVSVVPNGVDAEAFRPDPGVAPDPDESVFVGSLDWRPNQDAVGWWLDEIWPTIRERRPSATFTVVGRRPPAWLEKRVGAAPGARLFGSVPDVRPHVRRAAVSVVPLRVGGGSRLKICEALALERPVVSTTVGAEGLDVGDGVVLADSPSAFAEAVLRALADPAAARERAWRGRERVLRTHEWGAIAPLQAAAWEATVARGRGAT